LLGLVHFYLATQHFNAATSIPHCLYRVVQKKTHTQSLRHHRFATVRRRISQFAEKCSAKITVYHYQSTQNMGQYVKIFFDKACHHWRHPAVNKTHLWQLKIDCS